MTPFGSFLARATWTARRALAVLDPPALAALALAVALVAVHLFVLLPQQRGLEAASRMNLDVRGAPARTMARVGANADDEAQALQRFHGFFRTDERQADVIARLAVMAGELGLAYRRIDYRPLPESSLGLEGFQIQLPISGAYPEVRNFISTVLTRMPTMTLDQMEVARRKDGKEGVEAQLLLSYHYAATP